jgi:hypothetical protein
MADVARTLVVLLVLFVTGAPIARCLARERSEWTRFLFESCAIGLIAQLTIGIALVRAGHFTQPDVALVTAIVVAGGLGAGGWRLFREPPAVDIRWLVPLSVLLAVALALRAHPSYFIFETGDMGEYVNLANVTARGVNLVESFPHGFTMYLAASNLLLGQAHTVGGVPALGIMLVLGTLSFAKGLGLRAVAAFGAGAIMVVHPIMVWFSTFPVSESLYAPLLIAALYFLMQARVQSSHAYAVVSGLSLGLLLLVRGNAMLLAPILVVALLVSAAFDTEKAYRVQRTSAVVALVALAAAYAYDVRYVFKYFVGTQLHYYVPGRIYRVAHRLNLFEWSWWLVVAVVLGLGTLLVAAYLVRRFLKPRLEASSTLGFRLIYGVTAGGALVVALAIGSNGLNDSLVRWGPAVLGLALAGIVLMIARPGRYIDSMTGLVVVLGIATFSVLYAHRVPHARPAAFYLYWDRYLFSEVLPLVIVVVAIALHALGDLIAQKDAPSVRNRVIAAVALVAVVLAMVPEAIETHRVTRYTLFGDSYGVMARLNRATSAPGRPPVIVYSGLRTLPPYWFPNETYRVFALPLQQTFGRGVIGVLFDPHHTDKSYDPVTARALLRKKRISSGYLVDVRDPGDTPFPDDAHTHYVGAIDYRMPVIARSLHRSQERWHVIMVKLDVYALTT